MLACWKGGFGTHCFADLLGVVTLCFIWTIWRERNHCIFEGVEWSVVTSFLLWGNFLTCGT